MDPILKNEIESLENWQKNLEANLVLLVNDCDSYGVTEWRQSLMISLSEALQMVEDNLLNLYNAMNTEEEKQE